VIISHTKSVKAFLKVLGVIVGCELVGLVSTPFTLVAIPTWYASLNKPSFAPPNWIFAPVWTTLYCLMGIAAFLVWQRGSKKKNVKKALSYFLLQLFFNFLWSVLFFGLHSPLLGLIDIFALLVTLIITIYMFYNIVKPGAYLLVPYLLWVSFATILNFSLLLLNLPS
jgi:tryptophan-rich sensory protein